MQQDRSDKLTSQERERVKGVAAMLFAQAGLPVELGMNLTDASFETGYSGRAGASDPVHGVDYVIDYYEFLGLKPDSDTDDIKKQCARLLARYHDDQLMHLSEDEKSSGKFKRGVVEDAKEILLSSDRVVYDELLESFPEELISTSGVAIVNINHMTSSRRIDLRHLLGGEKGIGANDEIALLQAAFGGGAEADTGEGFDAIKSAYLDGDLKDKELRQAYKDALIMQLMCITLHEDAVWRDAGISNEIDPQQQDIIESSDEYVEQRVQQHQELEEEVRNLITDSNRLLSGGHVPLQLLPASTETEDSVEQLAPDDLVKYTANLAAKKVRSQRENIVEVAQERAAILKELVQLTDWQYLTENSERAEVVQVLSIRDGSIEGMLSYVRDGDSLKSQFRTELGEVSLERLSVEKIREEPLSEILQQMAQGGAAIALLFRCPEISRAMEGRYVAEEHFKD